MNVDDCNWFRSNYDRMTLNEMKLFYARMAIEHPDQDYSNKDSIKRFFDIDTESSVVEFGGWDGASARSVLDSDLIARWVNYELADIPHLVHDRYSVVDDSFIWDEDLSEFDTLVASHSIEHISEEHLGKLIWATRDIDRAYIDLPSSEKGWHNTTCTHVLNLTALEVAKRFESNGLSIVKTEKNEPSHNSDIVWLERK